MTKSRTHHEDEDAAEFNDLVENFGITSIVVPKADESLGVWHHINRHKQQIRNLHESLKALKRIVNGVARAKSDDDWTDTSILDLVRAELNARKVRWVNWIIKGLVSAGGVGILGGLGWLIRMAWIGFNAKH